MFRWLSWSGVWPLSRSVVHGKAICPGEPQAVISDIHGNLEALEAVLADIQQQGATSIVCLGDLVGYGPDPIACVRHAMKWDVVLMGNHDWAAMSKSDLPGWTSHTVKRTIFRFRRDIQEQNLDATLGKYLRERPKSHASRQALYLHGTPRDPVNEYLFPEDVYNRWKMKAIQRAVLLRSHARCRRIHSG